MTAYSLWEVILNGDSPTPTRVVDGVVQPIAPITVEQRLAKKNELKARGTLLMDLPDKHQLKFNIYKNAKSLMGATEKRFGGNKETKKVQQTLLKQQYENFTGSSSKSLDQIHDRHQKIIIQLEILDADNLEEMDLKWQMAMLTMRAKRLLRRTRRNLETNGTTSIGFEMSKVECYNCHRKGYFARECRSPKDTRNKDIQRRSVPVETSTSNALVSQCLKSIEARLVIYQQNENVFEEDITLLELNVMLRDNALVELRKKFKATEKERDELKHTLEKFQTSSKKSNDELTSFELDVSVPTSPVHDRYKSVEGYHAVPPPCTGTFMPPKHDLVFHDASTVSETVPTVFNVEPSTTKPTKELSQTSVKPVQHPTQAKNLKKDILKSRGHMHSWTRKACFVCKSVNHLIKDCDYYEKKMVQKPVRNHALRVSHQNSARMTHPLSKKHVVPTAVLTRSRLVLLTAARPVTTVVPQTNVTHQRPAKHFVNKPHSPIRRPINHRPAPKNSNFHQKITTIKSNKVNVVQSTKGKWIQVSHGLGPQKALSFLFDVQGNLQQALKDKCVIDIGCSRHMTGNISYLSDFKEINGGYVAFGGNPKGGKITGKGKIKTGKLYYDDVYFVKELKFNLFIILQMCDKKNSVLFIDTKCVVWSSDFKLLDENHVLLKVLRENNMCNVDLKNIVPSGDLTCLFAKATLDESNL
nr:ribonuclease H-like domain-containing protein [Tanacetum cinerariifolium]